jgi:Arc/MetJ family transcription regulator
VQLAREAASAQRVTDLTTYRAAVAALVARCAGSAVADELARYEVVATRWADTLDDDRPHAQAKYELLLSSTDLVGLARRC